MRKQGAAAPAAAKRVTDGKRLRRAIGETGEDGELASDEGEPGGGDDMVRLGGLMDKASVGRFV